MPTFHTKSASFHWLDISTLLALGGLFLGLFFMTLKKGKLVPVSDPDLSESINKH